MLLFSSAVHGWNLKDWRANVFNKGSTISIFKLTSGKVCGGYLHIPWQEGNNHVSDEEAFIFSVDHKACLLPVNPNSAASFTRAYGPLFGEASIRVLDSSSMNSENNFRSFCEGKVEKFNVPLD